MYKDTTKGTYMARKTPSAGTARFFEALPLVQIFHKFLI
jgi:hypothetical protein